MDQTLWLTLIGVILLMIVSSLMSLSETAFTALNRARLVALEKAGDVRAMRLARLTQKREKVVASLLLGNNLVNILATALTTTVMANAFDDAGVFYATILMTVVIVLFGEVLPKSFAIANAERAALFFSGFIAFVDWILRPFARTADWVARKTMQFFGRGNHERGALLSPHEEIRGQVDLLHMEGSAVKSDRDMLGGLLDLKELSVTDIMIHRTNMNGLDADEPIEELVEEALKSVNPRLPVWRHTPENIIGILHTKTLALAVHDARGDFSKLILDELIATPWFIPDTTTLEEQLKAFLKRKAHMALVVDEYGVVMGLVTLEDIIEEIVGDIADETDRTIEGVRPQADGSLSVDGQVPIRDLNRAMDWDLPDDEATTIAGLVIHEARMIPNPGQSFTFYGFKFDVTRRERNRITRIKIRPTEEARTAKPD